MQLKKLTALALNFVMILGLCTPAALAAGDTAPGYVLRGGMNGSTYDLKIYVTGLEALSGRIGLTFDTDKLSLNGSGVASFEMANGAIAVSESVPESKLVSGSDGYACTAWYVGGALDARNSEKQIATLRFTPVGGAAEIDQATFGLRCIEEGEIGEWTSAAHLRGKGELAPTTNSYMVEGVPACALTFAYDGADREPTNGNTVTFRCQTKLEGKPVSSEMLLGGRTYQTNAAGEISMKLAAGEYLWRVEATGYGVQRGKVSVSGNTDQEILFIDDAELVREAAQKLQIGYRKGDSEKRVTGTLGFTDSTAEGIKISWESDHPNIITKDGLVFLPQSEQANVKLTATLAKGSAKEQKEFTVTVLSKKQLEEEQQKPPDPAEDPNGETNSPGSTGSSEGKTLFKDLGAYGWAQDAIEKLARAGIIKGTGTDTFSPGQNIKRGDYIALLMRMIDPVGMPTTAFDDVPKDSYYFTEIAQARVLGIAEGTGDNRFEPEKPISRQDMMTMTARAIERTSYLSSSQNIGDLTQYADENKIAAYARESVAKMVGRGLITGDDKKCINPEANATRAETAVFIERIYSAHQ